MTVTGIKGCQVVGMGLHDKAGRVGGARGHAEKPNDARKSRKAWPRECMGSRLAQKALL